MNYIPLPKSESRFSVQPQLPLEPRRQPKGNYAGVTQTDEVTHYPFLSFVLVVTYTLIYSYLFEHIISQVLRHAYNELSKEYTRRHGTPGELQQ